MRGGTLSLECKDISFEIKAEPDANGTFEGYASVFDVVDNGLDIVAPGAFRRSLGESGRKVKMLWQHDPEQVIGVWDEIREDDRGLFVKGRLLKDVQKGREAMELLRAGAIDSMSIGYRTKEAERQGAGARRLIELDLFEVSLVTFPMLDAATVTDFKSINWTNKRDIERGLRDVFGLSQSEAKAFIADGFNGLQAKRDVDTVEAGAADYSPLMKQLQNLQEAFNV